MGGSSSGMQGQPEPLHAEGVVGLGHLLAAEGQPQETQGVAHPLVLVLEEETVPIGDDHLRGGAQTDEETTRRGVGHGGQALGQQGGPSGVRRRDGHAQVEGRLPGRRQGEGREAVCPVDLRGPDVGVSELAQAGEPLLVPVQGYPVEGDGDARAGPAGCRGRVSSSGLHRVLGRSDTAAFTLAGPVIADQLGLFGLPCRPRPRPSPSPTSAPTSAPDPL